LDWVRVRLSPDFIFWEIKARSGPKFSDFRAGNSL
jgi:hypothetical protein